MEVDSDLESEAPGFLGSHEEREFPEEQAGSHLDFGLRSMEYFPALISCQVCGNLLWQSGN